MIDFNISEEHIKEKIALAFQLNNIKILKELFGQNKPTETQMGFILNELKNNFSFEIMDFLYKNQIINIFQEKTYKLFAPLNSNIKPLLWLFMNDIAFSAHYDYFLNKNNLNTYNKKENYSTLYLSGIFSTLKFAKEKDFKIFINFISVLGKSEVFSRILRASGQDENSSHKNLVELAFSNFTNVMHENIDNKLCFEKFDDISRFINIFISNNIAHITNQLLIKERNNLLIWGEIRKHLISLYPFSKNAHIKDLCIFFAKKLKESNSHSSYYFRVSNFCINNFWKEKLDNFIRFTQHTPHLSDEAFIYLEVMRDFKYKNKDFFNYLKLMNQNEMSFFKNILIKNNSILVEILGYMPIKTGFTKKFIQIGINYINNYENHQIIFNPQDDTKIETTLFDLIVRSSFMSNSLNELKVILKDKNMLNFIIKKNILDELREISNYYQSTRLNKKIKMIEDKIVEYLLSSNNASNKNTHKKFKI